MNMETKAVLLNIRKKYSLSQDEMAEKLYVTRQAVSGWENGETVPNTDTLKSFLKTFVQEVANFGQRFTLHRAREGVVPLY